MSVTPNVGQRWLFAPSFAKNQNFVGEVVKVHPDGRCALRVVQDMGWRMVAVGHIYDTEDLTRPDYSYLEGQDKPV